MTRILITSGPTRQYLDPVRFLTNASSGRMGAALAEAAIEAGHRAVIVSGPVDVPYPAEAEVVRIVSTEELLEACLKIFPECDGLIAAAAPCDYRPRAVAKHKIRKTGDSLTLELLETPDVVASLSEIKIHQWMVAFALETEDKHLRAMQKLERKSCDLIVVNGPEAVHAAETAVEILDKSGGVVAAFSGGKSQIGRKILRVIGERLIAAARIL
ncbi:MAG: phosphopantothenoylcysteine decarboxylase [Pirellulales bacterium]|nr:phosphopantothenoylcysteine decarboxylase [Pirellulales bacterium]